MTETKKRRVLTYGVSSAAAVLIVAGILIALNVIGTRLFVRADLTEGKEFTVSKPTRQILRNLDDLVAIKVFFSKKLPPQLTTLSQEVADMVKEYQVYSRGKIQVQFIDPSSKPEEGQKAQAMGIPELQMNLLEKDQYQVTKVFMGIGVQYGDKVQAIPVVQDVETLEYDLTSAIVKVTRKEEKVLGFLTGHGEKDLQKDYQALNQELDRQYRIMPVNLNGGRSPVPAEVNTLVLAGPKNVSEREKYEIDQFIMRGGRAIFLIDPINMNEQMGLQAYPATSGLEDMLASYGAEVKSALVLDPRCAMASFAMGYISYSTPYPFWPKVSSSGLDRQNPITSRLESVTFPWTAPLALKAPPMTSETASGGTAKAADEPPASGSVQGVALARTTDKAWTQSGRYDLNPQSLMARSTQPAGESYPLAIALTGSFQSFYAGKAVPPKPVETPPPSADKDAPPPPVPAPDTTPAIVSSPETQVLVVGDSQFASNTFLRMFPENAIFLENAIDWMTLGNDLIAIRSRGATDRPVKELSAGAKTALKMILTFGWPLVVIAFGLARGVVRRRNRIRLAEAFRPIH